MANRLSPSAASRWMGCPASVKLIKELGKKESSVFANEGTRAHSILEKCLKDELSPVFYDGEMEEETFTALETAYEIIEQTILDLKLDYDEVVLNLEQKVKPAWMGIKGLTGGTADIVVLAYDGVILEELHVIDYKHGVGVSVEADQNPQLMIYALALLGPNANRQAKVTMEIVQPRDFKNSNPSRKMTMTAEQLYEWMEVELRPAAERTLWDKPVFGPAFKRCQFCDAAKVCPKLSRDALKIAELAEEKKELSKEERLYFFERADNIRLYLRKIESTVGAEMLDGEHYDGLKLVRKTTRRRYTSSAIREDSQIHDVLGDGMFKPRQPLGLGDMEKALASEMGRQDAKALMRDATWKPEGELTVALVSDRRKAVEPQSSAAEDFKGLTDNQ